MDTTPCTYALLGLCDTPEHQHPEPTPVIHRRRASGADHGTMCGSPDTFRVTLTGSGTTCPDCLALMAECAS